MLLCITFLVPPPFDHKISVPQGSFLWIFLYLYSDAGDLIQSSNFKYHSYAKDSNLDFQCRLSLKLPSCVSNSLQHLYLDVKCVSQMQHVTKCIPGSQILLFPPQSSPSMKSDAILPVAQTETMRVNLGFSFPLKLQIQTFSKSYRV